MSPPLRVKPTSIFSISSTGSLLDGAYTNGVSYASPLRRGQMSPRFVMFLAAFTTLALFLSSFNAPAPLQKPPLQNQTFAEDHRPSSPLPPPARFNLALPIPTTRAVPAKCLWSAPLLEEDFRVSRMHSNLTATPECAGPIVDPDVYPIPSQQPFANSTLFTRWSFFGLIMLLFMALGFVSEDTGEVLPLHGTYRTNTPTSSSLVYTWDWSSGSLVSSLSEGQLSFIQEEGFIDALKELSTSTSTNLGLVDSVKTLPAQFLSFVTELVEEFEEEASVEQGGESEETDILDIPSDDLEESSDWSSEEFEVEEIGIYYR